MAPTLIDHEDRRRALAEAAWRVLLRDGVAALSVRTVAAEAGVSAGSLRHVLPRQDDLLVISLEHVQRNARARIRALPDHLSGGARARAIAHELLPLDDERRAELEVQISLITVAFANAALRAVRDAANAAVLGACQHMIALIDKERGTTAASSSPDRERDARRLHALLDGLAAHLVQAPALLSPEDAVAILDDHLAQLAAGPAEQ